MRVFLDIWLFACACVCAGTSGLGCGGASLNSPFFVALQVMHMFRYTIANIESVEPFFVPQVHNYLQMQKQC